MNNQKVFKIRDNKTGLFSKGGSDPKWSKTGKTWSTEGQLKSHLTMYCDNEYPSTYPSRKRQIPESWEVVEYVVNVAESGVRSARDLAERKAKK